MEDFSTTEEEEEEVRAPLAEDAECDVELVIVGAGQQEDTVQSQGEPPQSKALLPAMTSSGKAKRKDEHPIPVKEMTVFSLLLLPDELGGLKNWEEALRNHLASLEDWRVDLQVMEILFTGNSTASWDDEASRDELLNKTSRGEFDFILAAH